MLFVVICMTLFTNIFAMDAATKLMIDRGFEKVKQEKLSLFSDQRCKSDCLGKAFKETSAPSPMGKSDEVIVFVSNAMPKQALKDLAVLSKTHKNVRLVIQGMIKGSMQGSAKLVEEIGYPLDIDPKLFEVHKITHVPVFMKQKEGKTYLVRGNVTLDFAIEKFGEDK